MDRARAAVCTKGGSVRPHRQITNRTLGSRPISSKQYVLKPQVWHGPELTRPNMYNVTPDVGDPSAPRPSLVSASIAELVFPQPA